MQKRENETKKEFLEQNLRQGGVLNDKLEKKWIRENFAASSLPLASPEVEVHDKIK